MKSEKEVREVFVSKYGKTSGKSEDRSSKKKGTHPFRQMATALASEISEWSFPALKGKKESSSRETCAPCFSRISQWSWSPQQIANAAYLMNFLQENEEVFL